MAINKSIAWFYLFFLGIFLGKYMFFQKISEHLKQDPPRWVLFMDRNSMGVYILHHTLIWLAIYYITPIREFMINNPVSGPWWLFLFVLPLSLLCSEYINKSKYSKYIFG
ncbi:acyltransferase family protein [Prevotella melaninogenica]|uniref:acyltransferase family protein n=1 Tax=Prevotella melaninogenica TaxID=28132 RepID=UPI002151CE67|nr:acyltransferase family protein [Prevotella melaninogenica]